MLRCLIAVALSVASVAFAQPWPGKPIRIVVTYPAGGGADAMARLVAPKLSEAFGQPVLVENRGGASGTIAAELVAKSPPDGYTLMLDATKPSPSTRASIRSFPTIRTRHSRRSRCSRSFPNVVVVHPSYPVSSIKELVAKIKAEPGKIAFASSGNGSAQHLAAELFRQRAGLDMVHVPYKGGGPALIDVMGGQVPIYFANMASALPHVKNGKLKALAVTGAQALARCARPADCGGVRHARLPGLRMERDLRAGRHAARDHQPAAGRDREGRKIPEVRERMLALGGEIVASSPADLAAWVREQSASWARVVRAGNIKLE
jgi:tripartite-type tricarboxylate transporter receptor subunit TctC